MLRGALRWAAQEWVAGAELAATFVLTRRDGGPHEAIPAGRARAGADPQWRQALSLYVDAYMHADLILRLAMVYSGGAEAARAPPPLATRCGVCVRGRQTWGLLRLPPPPSLPYKVDTSRPSLRTNWTRPVPSDVGAAAPPGRGGYRARGAPGAAAAGAAAPRACAPGQRG